MSRGAVRARRRRPVTCLHARFRRYVCGKLTKYLWKHTANLKRYRVVRAVHRVTGIATLVSAAIAAGDAAGQRPPTAAPS